MNKTRPYLSIDIEADGPIPGRNSLLSLGAVCFRPEPVEGDVEIHVLSKAKFNMKPLDGAKQNQETMEWWARQSPDTWASATRNATSPEEGTQAFVNWVLMLKADHGRPTPICYPTGFDWTFVHWYVQAFYGTNPLGFSCLDIKTLAAAKMNVPYHRAVKKNMPSEWLNGLPPHTHDAADDAMEQAFLFARMLKS